ncbi:MAG: histidine kinase N-terminal 7TM domain-containing protein, partial [Halobacteria archaeon]|nr:histidine kinase N-terminal 7TM domain-containing protein [Halobacteria archaeon]
MAPASFLGQMPLEVLLLVTGYLTSGLLSLGITVYSLRNRGDNPTVLAFAILTLSSSVWCFGFMGRLLSTSVTSKVVWETVGYLGLVSFPTTLLVFSLYYTGRGNWVTRRTLAFVSAVPAALFVLFATNFLHGMFLSDLSLSTSIGYPLLTATPQEVFWVNVVYNYAVYSLGILVLAYYAVEAPEPYRWQATLMTGGFGLTLVVNVGFLFGLEPFPAADPTPIAIGLTSAVLAVAILRAEFVNILPVARERIVETVNDGVVAVNEEGRVIDVNANAESLLGVENCIGRDVVELLPEEMIESGITDEGSDDQAEVKLERADGRTR